MSTVSEELRALSNKLKDLSFRGVGTSKYYPHGSETAYYRMEYLPAKLLLFHKSPWAAVEERFEVTYRSASDYNCASLRVYTGETLSRSCTSEEDLEKAYASDFGTRLLVVYLFMDPRVVIAAAEAVREIPSPEGFHKAFEVVALQNPSDPLFGLSVVAELFLRNDTLQMMRKRKFVGEKEIVDQNMEITFQY